MLNIFKTPVTRCKTVKMNKGVIFAFLLQHFFFVFKIISNRIWNFSKKLCLHGLKYLFAALKWSGWRCQLNGILHWCMVFSVIGNVIYCIYKASTSIISEASNLSNKHHKRLKVDNLSQHSAQNKVIFWKISKLFGSCVSMHPVQSVVIWERWA